MDKPGDAPPETPSASSDAPDAEASQPDESTLRDGVDSTGSSDPDRVDELLNALARVGAADEVEGSRQEAVPASDTEPSDAADSEGQLEGAVNPSAGSDHRRTDAPTESSEASFPGSSADEAARAQSIEPGAATLAATTSSSTASSVSAPPERTEHTPPTRAESIAYSSPTPPSRAEVARPARRTVGMGALMAATGISALIGGLIGGLLVSGFTSPGAEPTPTQTVQNTPTNPGPTGNIAAAIEKASKSVVQLDVSINGRNEVGSAIVVSPDGLVLTNAHVVTLDGTVNNASVRGATADGRRFNAIPVGIDAYSDLALLRLEGATDLVPAEFANSNSVKVGDTAIAIGAPLGFTQSTTLGVISSVDRSIEVRSAAAPPAASPEENAPFAIEQPRPATDTVQIAVLQSDASMNPGNSGGPLVDSSGRVVGVNVAIATAGAERQRGADGAGSIGLGFAIPAEVASRVVNDFVSGQMPSHGAVGAAVRSSSRDTLTTVTGAVIESISEGGPAARAGLQQGDVIIRVDGRTIRTASDFIAQVRAKPAGTEVEVRFAREGVESSVMVMLDPLA